MPDEMPAAFEARISDPRDLPVEVRPSWIVLDDLHLQPAGPMPGLVAAYPQARILMIDDDAEEWDVCGDLVLNPELGLRAPEGKEARLLWGERFAPLRPGLADPLPPPPGARPPEGRGLLVLPGGTDPTGLARAVLEQLLATDAGHFHPVVILASEHPDAAAVDRLLGRFPGGCRLEKVDSRRLAGWMRVCAAGVLACGSSVYEAAALGLPFLGVVAVENQIIKGAAVERLWRLPVLERSRVPHAPLGMILRRLVESGGCDRFVGIDGGGASRVVDRMEALERF
ncbi:MAG: hypothetical protein EA425_06220 [Puniceicoccaceae bacterium]|nr:MAG: hypothetical protein EA425_06220 [Puniceicoccaceae bacterium]